MIKRFEALAEEFLALAEGGTPQTRNSRLELRVQLAQAAAECAMAAETLRRNQEFGGIGDAPLPDPTCTSAPTHRVHVTATVEVTREVRVEDELDPEEAAVLAEEMALKQLNFDNIENVEVEEID
jgi:hypothetical protein